MKKGIDLSYANMVTDWEKVKGQVDFVILRAGYGQGNIDRNLGAYAAACEKHNIPLGLYWFSYAYTVEMARAEARYCIEQARKYKVTYPIAFDFEYDSVRYAQGLDRSITKELVMKLVTAFCGEIQAAGYIPCVYTNKDYGNRYFDLSAIKEEGYLIWYAYYNKTSDRDDIALWQYSSDGEIDGISGRVDMNYSLKDFAKEEGWQQDQEGRWRYLLEDGHHQSDSWRKIEGLWYHFDQDGYMQTGWIQDDGKWYYLKASGAMAANEMLTIHSDIYGDELYVFAADGHMLQTNDRGAAV